MTVVDPDAADALLPSWMSADEYGYVRACTITEARALVCNSILDDLFDI